MARANNKGPSGSPCWTRKEEDKRKPRKYYWLLHHRVNATHGMMVGHIIMNCLEDRISRDAVEGITEVYCKEPEKELRI